MSWAIGPRFGRDDLPEEQHEALKKATRWEFITIGVTIVTITAMAFVVGNSQAMRTAWIEDMLSLAPQISFLVALPFVRRKPTLKHPYGWHRAMGIGHLVAGVALFVMGANLAYESAISLMSAEHPTIGTVQLFGVTIWHGWLMVGFMVVTVTPPLFIYGPPKRKLAPLLHNKLLAADADMAKADWHTNAATIVGVLGVGLGFWWLDSAAALFIALGIVLDGFRNSRAALRDLLDQRAQTYDDETPHPLANDIVASLEANPWVVDGAVRMRDMGQVFHVEAFARPVNRPISIDEIERAERAIADLDWKVQDVRVILTSELPPEADRGPHEPEGRG